MNQLIHIANNQVGHSTIQTVNARELHAFLGSGIRFNDWIKRRIEDYGFTEGTDYTRIELTPDMKMADIGGRIGGIDNAQKSVQKNVALESTGYINHGQQGRIEYAISIDMAKELAMVERNEKGKQARQYFIECERQAKSIQVPQSLPEALRLAADLADDVARIGAQLSIAAPKAEALDRIEASEGTLTLTQAAKVLGVKFSVMVSRLHAEGWIYRQNDSWVAYENQIKVGRLQYKEARYTDQNTGQECRRPYCHITQKGMVKLAMMFGSFLPEADLRIKA